MTKHKMKQKLIGSTLYVFQVEPYQIIEDTSAEIIKVQEECVSGFKTLNASLADKIVAYNYHVMTATQQEWAPYVDEQDPVSPELAWSAESATVTIGADDNVFPTLSNPHSVEVTYSSSDTEKATINETTGEITLAAAGNTVISAVFAGNDTYTAQTVAYTLTVGEAVPGYTITLIGTGLNDETVTIKVNGETVPLTETYEGISYGVWFEIYPLEDVANYTLVSDNMQFAADDPSNYHWYVSPQEDMTIELNYTEPTYAEVEVTYDVQDTESEIELFSAGGGSPYEGTPTPPDAMFVDDNPETVVNSWRFDSTGDHTVKFVFQSGRVSTGFMQNNQTAKSINLNGQVTQISEYAFNSIQEPTLTSITSWAATPPTLEGNGDNQFGNVPIYVPADYVTDYQTAWTTYASQIQAMQS